jgi:hypothetical protein
VQVLIVAETRFPGFFGSEFSAMLILQNEVVTVAMPLSFVPLEQSRNSNGAVGPPVCVSRKTLPVASSFTTRFEIETVKLQLAVFPEPSEAVQLTVVVPGGKLLPEGGTHTVLATPQLSDAAVLNVTTAPPPGMGEPVDMLDGHEIAGGWVSLTVTVNEQLGPAADRQFTVVVPVGKNEPPGGLQTTAPQSPVVPGAGKLTTAPH